MRKIIYIFLGFSFFLTSCIEDDGFIDNPPVNTNFGQVSFDGITIPLTYADMYFVESYTNGDELWALILSENFIQPGTTLTDAYLYMEFIRPFNGSLQGNYFFGDAFRPILFSAYFEDVELFNGNIQGSNFQIDDSEIIDGSLQIRFTSPNGVHRFITELETFDGFFLDANFEGLLRV